MYDKNQLLQICFKNENVDVVKTAYQHLKDREELSNDDYIKIICSAQDTLFQNIVFQESEHKFSADDFKKLYQYTKNHTVKNRCVGKFEGFVPELVTELQIKMN